MATVHYTARLQRNGSLPVPKEIQAELGARPGDLVEVVLHSEDANVPELPPIPEGESLADFLGDFIGCVSGSGANNSDDTGEKFTEYLVEKHRQGRL